MSVLVLGWVCGFFLFVFVELYSLEPSFTGACYLGRRESPYDPETVGINIP